MRDRGRPDVPAAERPLVVLDFDNTCIRHDIGEALLLEAAERLAFRFDAGFWDAIPADMGRADLQAAVARLAPDSRHEVPPSADFLRWRKGMLLVYEGIIERDGGPASAAWLVQVLAGMRPADVRDLARATLAKELARPIGEELLATGPDDPQPVVMATGIRYHAEMRELVAALQRHGFDVWVVSASNQWTVEVAAAGIGIPADHVIAIRTLRDADGRLTSGIEPPLTYGPGKVEGIRQFIGRVPALAVGDAATDREMLAGADLALLIDKGDEELAAFAREKGWLVQPRFAVTE